MRILISAAEASSDAHGAELLKAIREQLPAGIHLDAFGIGGPRLQAAGLRTIVDARELLAMGFIEILGHLPKILRAMNRMVQAARETPPDVAIVVDYPDFHFRLAKRLNELRIPLIYYIPPKVWVWRKGRVRFLKQMFKKILCILPFEENFYLKENIPARYVGNPLLDELPLSLSKDEARAKLNLKAKDRVLVLMPGSRPSELRSHLEIMLESAFLSAKELRKSGVLQLGEVLKVLMPFPLTASFEVLQERVQQWMSSEKRNELEVQVFKGKAHECLVAADSGLIKSGTSTLEAGLLKCPHAIVYKPSWTTAWIFKNLIQYRGPVGLVNLVAGWNEGDEYLVREILLEEVTLDALTREIVSLMSDSMKRQKQIQGFDELRVKMKRDESPSLLAAKEVLRVIDDALEARRKDR